MIIVTGAENSMGSTYISKLTEEEYGDIVAVYEDSGVASDSDRANKRISKRLNHIQLSAWIETNQLYIQFVFHLAANPQPEYLKIVWNRCVEFGLPFVYTFKEDTAFNEWVQQQERQPYFWAGLQVSEAEAADVAETLYFLMHHRKDSGIYGLKEGAEKLREIGFHKELTR